MAMWRQFLPGALLLALCGAVRAEDPVPARKVLLQLEQGLQAQAAGRVRELLAPGAVITVTLVEPDGRAGFTFDREEFLQTYAALWRFSSAGKLALEIRRLQPDGKDGWTATADLRERMRVLDKDFRRESIATFRIRRHNDRFLIDGLQLQTMIDAPGRRR